MTETPSISVSLSPAGTLLMAFPGSLGHPRLIPLDSLGTLRRVLMAQAASKVEIGLDGAPTERQVLHWEKHWQFRSERCPFCREELAAEKAKEGKKLRDEVRTASRKGPIHRMPGGVEVRTIPPTRQSSETRRTVEDLGL